MADNTETQNAREVRHLLIMADSLLGLALHRKEADTKLWQDDATTLIGEIRSYLAGVQPEPPEDQIDRLARFIMDEIPGEPSQSEGAVDTAIRLLRAGLGPSCRCKRFVEPRDTLDV